MKQEEIDELMEKIDKKCKFPKHWNEFIKEQTKHDCVIMKDCQNKVCYCANCHHTFYDRHLRVNTIGKCPNCNNSYYILSKRAYNKNFITNVNLIQKFDKKVVIRVFEVLSYFNYETKQMERDIKEFCRIIPGFGKFLSNAVEFYLGFMRIYHYYDDGQTWRCYDGCRYFSDYPVYPYNRKRILEGTKMQYAPIKEFEKRYYRYNFLDALELAGYESFEILWKMKLYNLCFYAKYLNKNGNFYKRFGVPKSFLKYMQEKDISYRELLLLRLFQKPDDSLIEKYKYYNINYIRFLVKNNILDEFMKSNNCLARNEIDALKEIGKYLPLKKLKNYPKGLNNLYIYRDYLNMANELALNYKSRKDLFPRNLFSRHDKMQTKIKVNEEEKMQFCAYLRFLELSKYTYSDEKYIIFAAPSIDSMKDEGIQQGNCVGYRYLHPYTNGETEIFFIRQLNNVNKSFITLEFKNGRVAQKELPHHSRNFSKEQNEFIEKWVAYRVFVDKKKKYETKVKNIVNYKLSKQVA